MITTTTQTLQGREISEYLGVLYAFDSTQYSDRSAPNAIARAMAQLEELAAQRRAWYLACADAVVDGRTAEELAEKITEIWRKG